MSLKRQLASANNNRQIFLRSSARNLKGTARGDAVVPRRGQASANPGAISAGSLNWTPRSVRFCSVTVLLLCTFAISRTSRGHYEVVARRSFPFHSLSFSSQMPFEFFKKRVESFRQKDRHDVSMLSVLAKKSKGFKTRHGELALEFPRQVTSHKCASSVSDVDAVA